MIFGRVRNSTQDGSTPVRRYDICLFGNGAMAIRSRAASLAAPPPQRLLPPFRARFIQWQRAHPL